MKSCYLVVVCLILHFGLFADNVREMLERVPFARLPFVCSKGLPYPRPAWGYPYGANTQFSIEMYADLGLTVKEKADPNTDCTVIRKFKLHNEKYVLVAVGLDIAESGKNVLVIYRDGEFVDYIESGVSWWSDGVVFIKQWRITFDEEIIVTWLKVESEKPINVFSDFKSVNAQRIDTHYRIDECGKFQLIKEVKYKPENYAKSYLIDKTKNLWEGTETPLSESRSEPVNVSNQRIRW